VKAAALRKTTRGLFERAARRAVKRPARTPPPTQKSMHEV
jgi:hypothetical protein